MPSEAYIRHGVERQGKSSTCTSCYGRLIVRAVDPFIGSGASTAPDTDSEKGRLGAPMLLVF